MVRTAGLHSYSDIHLTDPRVARFVVGHFPVELPALDPARGAGAFHDAMPPGSSWCEATQGRDFFSWCDPVRWVVTNPPFGPLTLWLRQAFAVADEVVYLIPLSKLFSSPSRMRLVQEYGGIREVLYLGSGRTLGFHIGFAFGAVWFGRGYQGDTRWTWAEDCMGEVLRGRAPSSRKPDSAQQSLFSSQDL